MIFRALYILLLIPTISYSTEFNYNEVVISPGMVNISYTESAKNLKAENGSEQKLAAGTVSSVSMNLAFSLWSSQKKIWYLGGLAPIINGTTGTYYNVFTGLEFFLNSEASKSGYSGNGANIKVTPKLRYSWAMEIGIGYMTYLTETAQKTDLLFDFSILGSIGYSLTSNMGLKLSIGVGRGTGVTTSTFTTKAFLGMTYFLDEL